jgi:diamine N-acetyltransferase
VKVKTIIKQLITIEEITRSVDVLRRSFKTVADQFHLNKSNAPTNAAFIKSESLVEMANKGVKLYGLFLTEKQIGFVAYENAGNGIYYLEKLAVLPDYRHNGYGKQLVDFAFHKVKEEEGKEISIGIINENQILKEWYIKYGFIETGIKKFNHLPFTVCFLKKSVF